MGPSLQPGLLPVRAVLLAGAGPSFLYVVQNTLLGLGALPVYLIATTRFRRPVVGLLFALVYLAYTPVQFIVG